MIVTPASLVHNWKREIQKWLGPHRLRPEIVLSSNKKALVKAQVENFVRGNGKVKPALIVSYEMFVKIAPLMKSLSKSLLICDEGHRLKSSGTYLFRVSYLDEEKNFLVSNTGTTKTMQALCTFPSMRRLIITGTPIQNDLEEFYNVVNFVNPTVRVLEIVKTLD